MLRIIDILNEDVIATGLQAANKKEVINNLIELAQIEPEHKDAVRDAIFEREQVISTGIGKGVAIPHCQVSVLDKHYCSLIILDEPVAFESVDELPVQILVLLASPKIDKGQHLRLMSNISRFLINRPFRTKLLEAESSSDVLALLHQEDTKYT